MKKIKLFSLVAAALFAGSTMAVTLPKGTFSVTSDETELSKIAFGSSADVHYATAEGVVVFSAFDLNKSSDVTWQASANAGTSARTWTADTPFKGSAYYHTSTTAKCVTTKNESGKEREYCYRFTNAIKVQVCGKPSSGKDLVLNVYEVTGGAVADAPAFTSSSETDSIQTIENLDATKEYVLSVTTTCTSNVDLYEVAFYHSTAPKTEPWLTLSATEVELAVTPFATSDEAKVTLKGGNLTEGTYTLTVPNVAGLTVAPTSFKVAADGTVNQEITLTYTSDVDVLKTKAQLSVTINEILAQLDITYSALLTVDAITIFHWQMSGTGAPVAGTALTATGGTIMPGTTDTTKPFSVESAGYVGGVPDDMKAKDGKGVKFGGNVLSFKVALADNATFKAGDIVSICGYFPWKISSTSAHLGDLAASVVTGTDKYNYAVGQVVLTADADTLYLMRAEGGSTAIAAIKVERPTECADAEIALPENPDIEVANSALTITAPTLENPNGLVVKYVSSDAEVVAVDENTGALTKGTKTGMATITISWVRQTINTVRHCAGELAYTVTVKDGATEISNAEAYAPAQKVIRDGQLLIIRDGKTYTAQGVQVQ